MNHLIALKQVLVPISLFATLLGAAAMVVVLRRAQERERHETLRRMVDKGLALPPALLTFSRRPRSDLTRGCVLVGGGLGALALLLTASNLREYWAAALIPTLMGAGQLVAHWLGERAKRLQPVQREPDEP